MRLGENAGEKMTPSEFTFANSSKFRALIAAQYNKFRSLPIRYYNLDTSKKDKVDEFLVTFVNVAEFYQFGYEVPALELLNVTGEEAREFITNDQIVFKEIIDKLLEKERLSGREISHISNRITPILKQYARIQSMKGYVNAESIEPLKKETPDLKVEYWSLMLNYDYPHSSWLHEVYYWIVALSKQEIKIGRCQLEGCNKIFEVTPGGHPQKFCSDAHKAKAYRERKNKLITV